MNIIDDCTYWIRCRCNECYGIIFIEKLMRPNDPIPPKAICDNCGKMSEIKKKTYCEFEFSSEDRIIIDLIKEQAMNFRIGVGEKLDDILTMAERAKSVSEFMESITQIKENKNEEERIIATDEIHKY